MPKIHRIYAPSRNLANALCSLIADEGYPATTTDTGLLVVAHAPSDVINAACHVLSIGEAPHSKGYERSHYRRAFA